MKLIALGLGYRCKTTDANLSQEKSQKYRWLATFSTTTSSCVEWVVSVGDSGHGVDLEVFVWTYLGNWFNGSPRSEGGLSIIEPLVAEVLEVIVINVSNTLSNLAARNAATNRENLLTNFLNNVRRSLTSHKLVVKGITASVNLNVIQEEWVDCGKANTAVVHLSGKDLVSEEVVSEDTTVGVSVIKGLGHSNIGEISEHGMHWVVLLLHIVKVASVFVNAIASEQILKKEEGIVIGIFDGRSIVEDTNIRVNHLVVSDEHKGGNVDGFFLAKYLSRCLLRKALESRWNLRDKLIMVDVTSTNNNDVVTEVVSGVEITKVISWNSLDVIAVSLDGLAHHVLSVNVEMAVLKSSFHIAVVVVIMLLSNFLFNEFKLVGIESATSD